MACSAVEFWTVSSLVGAYVDLALAYLFLVGATIAFFASKFLSLFGLGLPCSCDGLFGHPTCAQTGLLLDFPVARVAAVHRSVRSRFPFDSLLPAGADSSPRCRYRDDCGSCCSSSQFRPSRSLSLPAPPPEDDAGEQTSVRRKVVEVGNTSNSLRLRRKCNIELLSDLERSCSTSGQWISENIKKIGEEIIAEEVKDSCSCVGGLSGCDEEEKLAVIKDLERKIEEEKGARASLYLDLEKERSAAASAADEAMGMISRLQKEKAELEMESHQYKRMIDEKCAYDEEEMEILKEIIVRREREKHVLEKELEMYKEMCISGERADQKFAKENVHSFVSSLDDPILVLQQIYKSIGKKKMENDCGVESSSMLNSNGGYSNLGNAIKSFVNVRNNVEVANSGDYFGQEFHEKSISMTEAQSSSNLRQSSCTEGSIFYDVCKQYESNYHENIPDLTATGSSDYRGSESTQNETESSILDVHVINDAQGLIEESGKENYISSAKEVSCRKEEEMELDIDRSCSEITNRSSHFDLRRSSMSSVDSERYKLDTEVELLRKRLEVIREGREKLGFSADHREKEEFQLQLLDEIASRLKDMNKETELAKSMRRASLPPTTSKIVL